LSASLGLSRAALAWKMMVKQPGSNSPAAQRPDEEVRRTGIAQSKPNFCGNIVDCHSRFHFGSVVFGKASKPEKFEFL
jgi:hypothetical protein